MRASLISASQAGPMRPITIFETGIRQDAQGRFCLNDLHRAAGGLAKHKPSEWLRNRQTQELAQEISRAGIPALVSINGGTRQGTYACRELVIAYAAWISPAFHVKVLQVFLAAVSPAAPLLQRPQPSYMAEAWFAMPATSSRLHGASRTSPSPTDPRNNVVSGAEWQRILRQRALLYRPYCPPRTARVLPAPACACTPVELGLRWRV